MSTDPQQDPASAEPTPPSPEASAPESSAADTGDASQKKVLIGSQRDAPAPAPAAKKPKPAPQRPKPPKAEADSDDPTKIPDDLSSTLAEASEEDGEPDYRLPVEGGRVQVPNRRQQMDDIEAEIEAAFGEQSLDDMMSGQTPAPAAVRLDEGDRVTATVIRIHREDVFFDLPQGNQGIASIRNFIAVPSVGDKMEVSIGSFQSSQRLYEVGIPGASTSVQDWGDIKEGIVVDAVVDGVNKGGLECAVGAARGFIPASQVATYHVKDLEEFKGRKLQCLVTEANPEKRNLVLSARAVAEKLQEDGKKELMGSLTIGQIREGTVTRIQDFGAFVDLGGVDGLVHVSQISWDRVSHPSNVLAEGQVVKVKVTKMDPETGKIGLSIRDTMENPWQKVASEFAVGKVVPGKVTKLMDFGAFVEIAPGIEGLVHVSEVSYSRISRVSSVLKTGEDVEVKVLSIDQAKRRISLSIKATQPPPADARQGGRRKDEPEVDIDRELSVKKKSDQPLKGGISNDQSEGAKFGLKW
ncbi:30S ribosomal protein S1 [Bremerella cremea]|uniref:30S ribosomal protein S1 n=1 Tax=Bremerella cremea TaxID=1031537 RepID=UPI0031EC5E9B